MINLGRRLLLNSKNKKGNTMRVLWAGTVNCAGIDNGNIFVVPDQTLTWKTNEIKYFTSSVGEKVTTNGVTLNSEGGMLFFEGIYSCDVTYAATSSSYCPVPSLSFENYSANLSSNNYLEFYSYIFPINSILGQYSTVGGGITVEDGEVKVYISIKSNNCEFTYNLKYFAISLFAKGVIYEI